MRKIIYLSLIFLVPVNLLAQGEALKSFHSMNALFSSPKLFNLQDRVVDVPIRNIKWVLHKKFRDLVADGFIDQGTFLPGTANFLSSSSNNKNLFFIHQPDGGVKRSFRTHGKILDLHLHRGFFVAVLYKKYYLKSAIESKSEIELTYPSEITATAFSKIKDEFTNLAIAYKDGLVSVWRLNYNDGNIISKEIKRLNFGQEINFLSWDRQDNQLAIAGVNNGNAIFVWDTQNDKARKLEGHTAAITHIDFSKNGNKIISASQDRLGKLWDLETGDTFTFEGHIGPVNSIVFSRLETHVVTAGQDGRAMVWDIKNDNVSAIEASEPLAFAFFDSDDNVVTTAKPGLINTWRKVESFSLKSRKPIGRVIPSNGLPAKPTSKPLDE